MSSFEFLMGGFESALTMTNLMYCFLGVIMGMLIGILPGLGPTAGTAIFLPLTFSMEPITAIIMLSGIYYGSMYGGTITSVLINIPGEAASLMTCIDGYPLAKQGRAGVALGVSAIGSFIGGSLSILGLVLVGPPLARMALKFGSPEFFALAFMGLSLLLGLMGKSLLKGFMAALFGFALSFVGMDPNSGVVRFAFGNMYLIGGIDFVSIAMGVFGLSEIFLNLEESLKVKPPEPIKLTGMLPRKEEWPPVLKSMGRGTILGFFVGLIPGTSAVVTTIMSYTMEKKIAKDPSRFGKGALEGIAGPETANNAYCGGSLIPLFTLGLPTSTTMAVLLGAFTMHGLQPGPTLFQKNPEVVWAVIASMFIGNLILITLNLPLANVWAKVTKVPYKVMFPIIVFISVVGMFSLNNRMFDIQIMLIFGIIGYLLKKADFPLAPILLTYVLGGLLEKSFLQSLVMFDGNILGFFTRPISAVIMAISFAVIIVSVVAEVRNKRKGFEESEV